MSYFNSSLHNTTISHAMILYATKFSIYVNSRWEHVFNFVTILNTCITYQPINRPTIQPINHSTKHSINQPLNTALFLSFREALQPANVIKLECLLVQVDCPMTVETIYTFLNVVSNCLYRYSVYPVWPCVLLKCQGHLQFSILTYF